MRQKLLILIFSNKTSVQSFVFVVQLGSVELLRVGVKPAVFS